MPKLFGTDGVRGVANTELTPELALSIGRAAAQVLRSKASRPRIVVGRDTRASGDMLASALAAGLLSGGANVIRCRVLPTPAVAYLVTELGASGGGMVSASHNPAADNGIKFFGPDGFKLSDDEEQRIEDLLYSEINRPVGAAVGRLEFVEQAEDLYIGHAVRSLAGLDLKGLKVVLDCAHGAAYKTSPEAFRRAGAEVVVIGDAPDGANINQDFGALTPGTVAAEVVRAGADIGLAHDGDADRVIAVDETGTVVDGDAMLAALALSLKDADILAGNLVVTTVMANLGFHKAMSQAGIEVVETDVGDRFVLEAMRRHGAVAGGEQSGHLIFLENSTTGDGLISALKLAGLMVRTGKKLSEVASVVEKFPQILLNIPVADPDRLVTCDEVWNAVELAKANLGSSGRVLVRPSGTEPLVRVMVEASDDASAARVAQEISETVARCLGPAGSGR